jgi:hypothetical protein
MGLFFIHGEGHVEHWMARALAAESELRELTLDRALRGSPKTNPSLSNLLAGETVSSSLVIHCTDRFLPAGLEVSQFPTACWLVDVFVGTNSSLRWAMLFDYVFIAHPRFVATFRSAGHPNVYSLPLAAPPTFFGSSRDDTDRHFDVGWVGRSKGPLFTSRARILPRLARRFHMNEWQMWRSYEETANIFQHSKIVVNVSRDDYPCDANMRVFEAMAAGALLITRIPTELIDLGFCEGEHFVGYRDEADLEDIVSDFLARRADRLAIAANGCQLVRQKHMYEHRALSILETVERSRERSFAPARSWPVEKVLLAYLYFHCSSRSFRFAAQTMADLIKSNTAASLKALPLIGRTLAREVRNTLGA